MALKTITSTFFYIVHLAALGLPCVTLGLLYQYDMQLQSVPTYTSASASIPSKRATTSGDITHYEANTIFRCFIIALLVCSFLNCFKFKDCGKFEDLTTNEMVFRISIVWTGIVAIAQDPMFDTAMTSSSNGYATGITVMVWISLAAAVFSAAFELCILFITRIVVSGGEKNTEPDPAAAAPLEEVPE